MKFSFLLDVKWKEFLKEELNSDYFQTLSQFVEKSYKKYPCYPPLEDVFKALNLCPLEKVKVVLLGQDPYPKKGQANGLCFSVNKGVKHPPSLINIFKELQKDLGYPPPICGDLSAWAEQGVLLLNTILTVEQGKAGSHQNQGWEQFTDAIIKKISQNQEHIVFLLWGEMAKKKTKLISPKHCILTAGHPSPLSANRGYWFGNKHFSKTNKILKQYHLSPINWVL